LFLIITSVNNILLMAEVTHVRATAENGEKQKPAKEGALAAPPPYR
jgi:hypothetical protein